MNLWIIIWFLLNGNRGYTGSACGQSDCAGRNDYRGMLGDALPGDETCGCTGTEKSGSGYLADSGSCGCGRMQENDDCGVTGIKEREKNDCGCSSSEVTDFPSF